MTIYPLFLWEMLVSPAVSLEGHVDQNKQKKALYLELFPWYVIKKNPMFFICFLVLSSAFGTAAQNLLTGSVTAVVAGGRLGSFSLVGAPASSVRIFTISPVPTITT